MTSTHERTQQPGAGAAAMTRTEAEDFLYREARLIDDGRLQEWLDLTTDDVIYWVPANDAADDPRTHLSIIWDNHVELEARIWRITESGINHSQDPPSKTVRIVSNVEVEAADDPNEVTVYANALLNEFRPGWQRRERSVAHHYPMRCQYRLRREDGEWKIAYKKVHLLESDGILNSMTFLI